MLSPDIVKSYNSVRKTRNKALLCHAPFTNLNFEQNGNVTACCFNRKEVLGKYPDNSIEEIWNGKALQEFREKIKTNDLAGGCKLCRILLESGNYNGAKAIHYDEYAHEQSMNDKLSAIFGNTFKIYPKVFEFEISNVCNLECEMCSGYFSSTIRKNREKLPEIPQPYDAAFVEQVAQFMPKLTDLKFLGGEPFLIDIYYKIWDKVAEINPSIRIHTTTNGTVYNNRVEKLLEKLNIGIVVSLDSVNEQNYEKIRAGAKFERVMHHFSLFKQMSKRKKTYISIATCVMSNNWMDIPDVVRFANQQDVRIHFNIVWNPGHLSIRFLQYAEIEKIVQFLQLEKFDTETAIAKYNLNNYEEIINTLEYWKKERSFTRLIDDPENHYAFHAENLSSLPSDVYSRELAHLLLFHFMEGKKEDNNLRKIQDFFGHSLDENTDVGKEVFKLWREQGDSKFTNNLLDMYPALHLILLGDEGLEAFKKRTREVKEILLNFKLLQAVISDTVDDISKYGILRQIKIVKNNEIAALQEHLEESY